ncbi:MAG TPA: DUF1848 family protein [Candidatus Deferrimicrobiaceae bacterium]|nr:DUF1848 family protein [Candidatus Deferrimicrobiaceae bacterium]
MTLHIVSASRRTDIPQFYGDWFAFRRKAGYCESRNVFGGSYRISLRSEDVAAYLFWSKNTTPFERQIDALLAEGIPVAIQFTLTGYGRSVEAAIPEAPVTIPAFRRVSALLPGPAAIQWRYDPILLSECRGADWHRRNFRRIASRLEGATRVCNISFIEPYLKVVRRMGSGITYRTADIERHRRVSAKYPRLRQPGGEGARLAEDLSAIAKEHGMELRACSNPEYRLPRAQCCGVELFGGYGIAGKLEGSPPGPSRMSCRCLKVLDIGMDNTCPGGCRYCYVTDAPITAERNFQHHAVDAVRMR